MSPPGLGQWALLALSAASLADCECIPQLHKDSVTGECYETIGFDPWTINTPFSCSLWDECAVTACSANQDCARARACSELTHCWEDGGSRSVGCGAGTCVPVWSPPEECDDAGSCASPAAVCKQGACIIPLDQPCPLGGDQ
jgi:hypothetical protein